ncbi:MAG: hypothetical protein ACE5G5_08030 [Candidatus Methylomirabilales bacterium]
MAENARGGRGLAFLALFISITALVIAILAYQRTGAGMRELQEALNSARQETANAVGRLEELVRGTQQGRR